MVISGRECGHITAAVHETESMLASFNVATVMLFALRLTLLRQFFISIVVTLLIFQIYYPCARASLKV